MSYMILSHYQISMAFVFFLLRGGWDHLLRDPQARLWDSLLGTFFDKDPYIPRPRTRDKQIQVISEEHLAIWPVLKFLALLVCYFHVFKQDNLELSVKHSKVVKQFDEILQLSGDSGNAFMAVPLTQSDLTHQDLEATLSIGSMVGWNPVPSPLVVNFVGPKWQ